MIQIFKEIEERIDNLQRNQHNVDNDDVDHNDDEDDDDDDHDNDDDDADDDSIDDDDDNDDDDHDDDDPKMTQMIFKWFRMTLTMHHQPKSEWNIWFA